MASLRVVGFASGSPLSRAVMARMAQDHTLAGIVLPPRREGMVSALRGRLARFRNPLRQLGAPFVEIAEVPRLRPDAIVVASFPRIIPAAILDTARVGAFNLHMSLLPRHRGVDPIFWTYWHDDRNAGISTHWMTETLDAGDVAAQQSINLPRATPSRMLYMQLVSIGTQQIAGVLARAARDGGSRTTQDPQSATYASRADIAKARIPFAHWPAERVWHVLCGLADQRTGLVEDAQRRPLRHGTASGYRSTASVDPGRIDTVRSGFELHCMDGIVELQAHHVPAR